MDLKRFPKLAERATRIHAAIAPIIKSNPDRVVIHSDECADAAAEQLKKDSIRKPMLSRREDWLRTIVAADAEAFACLAPHIEVQLSVLQSPVRWTAWGMKVHPIEGLSQEVAEFLLLHFGPCWLTIDAGGYAEMLAGLLDHMPRLARVGAA